MPNHVINIITVKGNKEKVRALFKSIKAKKKDEDGEKREIDFNQIMPMPEDLQIESGSASWTAKEVIAKMVKDKKFNLKEYALENIEEFTKNGSLAPYIKNYLKYGAVDWYDWACENWGTKWNAYEIVRERKNPNRITFQTAWSTPVNVIQTLSSQHPDLVIHVDYADEDLGSNCGWYELKNGMDVDSYTPNGEEALQFACDLWGYDYEEMKKEREGA